MPLVTTDAIVLHAADYLESSRLLRLMTRAAGVQSVVARGARNSRKRFGHAVDLFAEGQAQIEMRPGRDLHTLTAFDVQRARPAIAADLGRFSAAAAVAECTLRIVHDDAQPGVYDDVRAICETIAALEGLPLISAVLGALWRLVRAVGFAPTLDRCADCQDLLDPEGPLPFSHQAGGLLCARCGLSVRAGRQLPQEARQTLSGWLRGQQPFLTDREARAHQRLFREFLAHHVGDGRPLRAFLSWENGQIDRM